MYPQEYLFKVSNIIMEKWSNQRLVVSSCRTGMVTLQGTWWQGACAVLLMMRFDTRDAYNGISRTITVKLWFVWKLCGDSATRVNPHVMMRVSTVWRFWATWVPAVMLDRIQRFNWVFVVYTKGKRERLCGIQRGGGRPVYLTQERRLSSTPPRNRNTLPTPSGSQTTISNSTDFKY